MNTKTTVSCLIRRLNIKRLCRSSMQEGKMPKSNGKPERATRAREFLKRTSRNGRERKGKCKKKAKRKHIKWHTFVFRTSRNASRHRENFYFYRSSQFVLFWTSLRREGGVCQLYHCRSGNPKSIPLSSLQSRNTNNPPARQSII